MWTSSTQVPTPIRVAILGAGGLGQAACRIIGLKKELRLTALCDSKGLVVSPEGLAGEWLTSSTQHDLVSRYQAGGAAVSEHDSRGGVIPPPIRPPEAWLTLGQPDCRRQSRIGGGMMTDAVRAVHCDDPLGAMLEHVDDIDAFLVTLPNLPNEFIPSVVERFARAAKRVVLVDVLKRTSAVEQLFALDQLVGASEGVVITGCGATPGLLTAAAVLAAQSFIDVERVDIWWGVGMANWNAYQATIREDIAHLSGYSVERANAMTDAEVETLLAKTNGVLELHQMEHADDVLLQRVGVVQSPEQVEVGGVMDTRHAKKPVSTTMTLTGTTFEGKRASHRFVLGDETTMAANVIGPALGYLKRALWLRQRGVYGVFGSTEFLPMIVR